MKGNVFKRLLYCLFASLIVAFLLSGLNSKRNEGNEARQGATLQVMFVVLICLVQFVLSLTAILNYIDAVRKNFFASAITFLFLPAVMVVAMMRMFFEADGPQNNSRMFLATIGPSIFYLLMLLYQFVLFRRTINVPS
jgi:hypothetical protein